MAAYPDPLTSGATWRAPFTRTLEFRTKIARGKNSTEQRWAETAGVEKWRLQYNRLPLVDRDQLFTAFESAKGSFDDTLTLTWGGVTYTDVYFDGDKLEAVQQTPTQWNMAVQLCQVQRAADTGALGTFPLLSSGARVQLPYTYGRQFDTTVVRTDGGRFAYYNRTGSLRMWTAGGPKLNATDAQALWNFFRRARGKLTTFPFTDPDSGVVYPSCRFGSDSLDWTYNSPQSNQIVTTVEQFV